MFCPYAPGRLSKRAGGRRVKGSVIAQPRDAQRRLAQLEGADCRQHDGAAPHTTPVGIQSKL